MPPVAPRDGVLTADNDNLATALRDLVPDQFRDTDQYLNIVQWNLEWFGATRSRTWDRVRTDTILEVLRALNADLFVFQEVKGPSGDGRYPGALDQLADDLTASGAGDYAVFYTEAGGEQRVAMMWDRDWIRAKGEVTDLFKRGEYKTERGKDAFAGRTPLHGHFTVRGSYDDALGTSSRFDFQVLGVHLKAMEDGGPQRLRSAEVLAEWLTDVAPQVDADVLVMGDWNAPPDAECWKPFHDMDGDPDNPKTKVVFRAINDPSDFSYLWLRNRTTKYVSRIDLHAVSLCSADEIVPEFAGKAVRWRPIEDAIARAGNLRDREVRDVMQRIKEHVSDHLPVVTRFYLTDDRE
jgi:endonuclease/exonuclease/phosphatase family metal-dependent hydrolase